MENLLNWSRSQTGKIEYKPTSIDLSTLIKDAIQISSSVALKKQIEVDFIEKANSTVFADINMIDTIFRNLLTNAIKYSFEKSKIDVILTNEDTSAIIEVRDYGVGISEDNCKKIFRIDSKFHTEGTKQEHGTGLGLILCREFIEKNNGKIWINSKLGVGSSFMFSLPKA